MQSCDPYTYPSNCPYPDYGYNTTPDPTAVVPVQHLNIFQQFFGTSPTVIVINTVLALVVLYLAYRYLLLPVVAFFLRLLNFRRLRETDAVFLEITPPAHLETTPLSAQKFITTVQDILGNGGVLSLETVASPTEGTRYLVRIRASDANVLQGHIASHMPDARFRILKNPYTPEAAGTGSLHRLLEFKQTRHYGLPLHKQEDYTQHDLATYLAGAMTKLESGEAIVMQTVITPHYSQRANRLYNKISRNGHAVLDGHVLHFILSRWWVWVISLLYGSVTHDLKAGLSLMVVGLVVYFFIPKKETPLQPAQQRIYDQVLEKLGQPLFRADIRVLVVADDNVRINSLTKGIRTSLAPLNVSGFQELRVKRNHAFSFLQKLAMHRFIHRLPSLLARNSNILATSELADIYHFPYGDIQTEDVVKSRSRTLPAPLSIKNGAFDVLLGRNQHHGSTNDVGLTAEQREQHMYVIGGTGNGKTTMLQYAIVQDILNGKGVAVIDPHGDLAERILRYIPEERMNDVVYLDPSDVSHPLGLNLLEVPGDVSGDERLLAQDFVTEAVVSVFRKIFSEDDSGGHRIEHVLRNAAHTAFTVEDATLFTVRKLLNNPKFRKGIIDRLEEEDLKDFWVNEFALAGNYQKYKAMDGVITKIARFQRSVVTRRILEQPTSTVNFDDILDGKILICNLAKGTIGEDTSQVLGTAILTRLQLAAFRRIRTGEEERKPFYLYVDEFQNFVSPLFIQMLSESRKYKLFLAVAEQSTSQQDRQLTENILDNAGTVVCFRTGNPADEELMMHQFKGSVREGEIMHLPKYSFYMRTANDDAQEIFSAKTVVLEDKGSEGVSDEVKSVSRDNYTKEYKPPRPATNPKKRPAKTGQPETTPDATTVTEFPENA